jgi:hypothetical protein
MVRFSTYTTPISARDARGQVAAIYAQLRRDLGSVADPVALHAPIPDLLGGAWAMVREILLAGQVARGHSARAIIGDHLAIWDGAAPPLSRGWVEQAVAGLGEPEAAVRLGLLAAMASYQIDDGVVAAYRRHYPDDASLVAALAWASFAAARRTAAATANATTLHDE